jgi:hypothetical protein
MCRIKPCRLSICLHRSSSMSRVYNRNRRWWVISTTKQSIWDNLSITNQQQQNKPTPITLSQTINTNLPHHPTNPPYNHPSHPTFSTNCNPASSRSTSYQPNCKSRLKSSRCSSANLRNVSNSLRCIRNSMSGINSRIEQNLQVRGRKINRLRGDMRAHSPGRWSISTRFSTTTMKCFRYLALSKSPFNSYIKTHIYSKTILPLPTASCPTVLTASTVNSQPPTIRRIPTLMSN